MEIILFFAFCFVYFIIQNNFQNEKTESHELRPRQQEHLLRWKILQGQGERRWSSLQQELQQQEASICLSQGTGRLIYSY